MADVWLFRESFATLVPRREAMLCLQAVSYAGFSPVKEILISTQALCLQEGLNRTMPPAALHMAFLLQPPLLL